MKRLLCWLLLLVGLSGAAQADTDIYHTPAKDQLSEKEARALMAEFYQNLWGVDITPCFRKGQYTALFGPGSQWYVDTEDDCWVISVEFDTELPIVPHMLLHGTTCEVLEWQFREKETKVTYQRAIPGEADLPLEETIAIAREQFAAALIQLDAPVQEISVYLRTFGLYGLLHDPAEVENPEQLAWCVGLYSGDWVAEYYIRANDGYILDSQVRQVTY